jgi:hypothetical protein
VVIGVSAAALMTAATAFVSVAPASATPSNCRTFPGSRDDQGYATCSQGTGGYQAQILCDATWPTDNYWKFGGWYSPQSGIPSFAVCSNGDDVMQIKVGLRN